MTKLEILEIIELFLEADDEIKDYVVKILKSQQQHPESQD